MDRYFTTTAKCIEVYCSQPGPNEGRLIGYVVKFGGGWDGYRVPAFGRGVEDLAKVACNATYGESLAAVAGDQPHQNGYLVTEPELTWAEADREWGRIGLAAEAIPS